eukprot:TRINITY_DN791_c1_g1_i1.p1 TRINITY_DN791_c1_g1~~TRINITY_DN791_c1_g1_i1.p1  ORF type:complete len:173 (+),score=25.73 TRINITY_DN791_c1_g1_i1:569-1087(+)
MSMNNIGKPIDSSTKDLQPPPDSRLKRRHTSSLRDADDVSKHRKYHSGGAKIFDTVVTSTTPQAKTNGRNILRETQRARGFRIREVSPIQEDIQSTPPRDNLTSSESTSLSMTDSSTETTQTTPVQTDENNTNHIIEVAPRDRAMSSVPIVGIINSEVVLSETQAKEELIST